VHLRSSKSVELIFRDVCEILSNEIGTHLGLRADARPSIANSLSRRICEILGPALEIDKKAFVSTRRAYFIDEIDSWDTSYEEKYYEVLRTGSWSQVLDRMPGLANAFDIITSNWKQSVVSIVTKLRTDRERLSCFLQCDVADLEISALYTELSDPHHGGASVARIDTISGRSFIYKPRSIKQELHLHYLLNEIRSMGYFNRVYVPAVLDMKTYGYAEFIQHAQFSCGREIETYYEIAGEALALFSAIDLTDCHHQNIVASKHGPVVVDAETLGSTWVTSWLSDAMFSNYNLPEAHLRSGLLPDFRRDTNGIVYDRGGFSGPIKVDAIEGRRFSLNKESKDKSRANVPVLNGVPQLPVGSAMDKFICGFESGVRQLNELKRRVTSVRMNYRPTDMRVVLRSTRSYLSLLTRSIIRPTHELRHVLRASIRLARCPGLAELIVEAEAESLSRLDVPRFSICDNALYSGNILVAELPFSARGGVDFNPPVICSTELRSLLACVDA
jgi:lantibiotic modifying enzyme